MVEHHSYLPLFLSAHFDYNRTFPHHSQGPTYRNPTCSLVYRNYSTRYEYTFSFFRCSILERVNKPCVRYSPVLLPLYRPLTCIIFFDELDDSLVWLASYTSRTDPVNSLNPLLAVPLTPSLLSSIVTMHKGVYMPVIADLT